MPKQKKTKKLSGVYVCEKCHNTMPVGIKCTFCNRKKKTKTVKAWGIVIRMFKDDEWGVPVEIGFYRNGLVYKAREHTGFGLQAKVIPITITYKV